MQFRTHGGGTGKGETRKPRWRESDNEGEENKVKSTGESIREKESEKKRSRVTGGIVLVTRVNSMIRGD